VSGGANVHQSWRFENDQAARCGVKKPAIIVTAGGGEQSVR
jgi:hypothetical protein